MLSVHSGRIWSVCSGFRLVCSGFALRRVKGVNVRNTLKIECTDLIETVDLPKNAAYHRASFWKIDEGTVRSLVDFSM